MNEQFNENEALKETKIYQDTVKEEMNGEAHPGAESDPREIRISTHMTAVVDKTEQAIMALPKGPDRARPQAPEVAAAATGCPDDRPG
jgi:hypothetical protein